MYVVGVAGFSGAGKTTFIERLIPVLAERGRVATIKSIHEDIAVDEPGKDTDRHRTAGAHAVIGVTPSATFRIRGDGKGDGSHQTEADALERVLDEFADDGIEYTLIEGFKRSVIPKFLVGDIPLHDAGGVVVDRIDPAPESTVDDGERFVTAIEELREYETTTSLLVSGSDASSTSSGVRAAVTGRIPRGNPPDAWTADGRFAIGETLVPDDAGSLWTIHDDLNRRDGVHESRVYLRPPVGVDDDRTTVSVVVHADDRDRAYDAAVDGSHRLAELCSMPHEAFMADGECVIRRV